MRSRARLITAMAVLCGGISLAGSAFASSDYLLQIEDYAGPGKPGTIEIQSWSWGASNPTSVGSSGMSAGRASRPLPTPLPVNGSVSVIGAREASSGMATGRRACAMGKHFTHVILQARSENWALAGVAVAECSADIMRLTYTSATRAPAGADAAVVKSKSNIGNN